MRDEVDDARDEADLLDLIRLTSVPGVGPKTSRALLTRFGSASAVLHAPEAAVREVAGVGAGLARKIARAEVEIDAEAELALCDRHGVTPISHHSNTYPSRLKEIADPPALLYVRGSLEPVDALAVAIVGSRKCTPYGLRIAERLATSLARVGLTVVSGLARGIDAAAHRGAIQGGGRTLAVLANGLSRVYPPEHDKLADEVAAHGALIAESPMRQEPIAGLFPQRNRIISGLSLGVVVVEATPRSGSLSTATHATEQNREVFAVPGPVDSLPSRGCHHLIRDGARLVETVDDILEELGPMVRGLDRPAEPLIQAATPPPGVTLNGPEGQILASLTDQPMPIDQIIALTGLSASATMATLSILELRRLIRRHPGQQFARA